MASQRAQAPAAAVAQTAAQGAISPELFESKLSLGIWHILSHWRALTKAVQENWGGPSSSSKRDWFASTLATQLIDDPSTPDDDIQIILLQVMADEFDVDVDDDSEEAVVAGIMRVWRDCLKGDFRRVDEMQEEWVGRRGVEKVETGNVEEREVEGDSDELSESDEDVDMGEAPAAAPSVKKEKPIPEVDEEGFEKVVRRR